MKLPNASHAIIEERKLYEYLLSSSHPIGRFKARFFSALGFSRANAEELAKGLRRIAEQGQVEHHETSEFGRKYLIPGVLSCPGGKSAAVVTVWFIRTGDDHPRLVTVYPR